MSYLTHEEFQKYLIGMRETPYLIVDCEGSLNHPYSETWGVSTSAFGVSEYFGFNHKIGNNLPTEWLPELKQVIENHPCLVMHNAKHDLKALRNLGINFKGNFKCTMLMGHMTNENRFNQGLDALSKAYDGTGKQMPKGMQIVIDHFGWHMVPLSMMREYSGGFGDSYITEDMFYKLLEDYNAEFEDPEGLWSWEQELVRIVGGIEDRGLLVDLDLAHTETKRGTVIMDDIRSYLRFDPMSPTELGKFLLDELSLPVVKRTDKGKPSFNKDAMKIYDEILSSMNDDRAKKIITYRGWARVISSNYRAYEQHMSPQDGRLRTEYKMHGTVTGRWSCAYHHQVPRLSPKDWNGRVKETFITEPGRTRWEIDYSQLEFRLGAAYGQVKNLIEIFNDESRDVFDETAAAIRMGRDPTKTMVYLIQYGGQAGRLSRTLGISELAAETRINQFFKTYPGLYKLNKLAERRARENGEIKYWSGRKRHFMFSSENRKAMSSLLQGGAFEIIKRQMVEAHKAGLNNDECAMDVQVHDSVGLDIVNGKEDEYLPEYIKIMEDVGKLHPVLDTVKFRVGVNKWATKNKWVGSNK